MSDQLKAGRPRDSAKRQRVLDALSGDPDMFLELGTPPYNVAHIAETLAVDPANLRKYLIRLEADGLVVRELRKVEIWNAIAGGHLGRTCLCFWNAATMDQDKRAADAWHAGADARSEAVFAGGMFQARPPATLLIEA